ALDRASMTYMHRHIKAMEQRGFIRRLPNRARAMEVLRQPDSIAPGLNAARRFSAGIIQGGLGQAKTGEASRMPAAGNDDDAGAAVSIRVMGRIAAGVPIAAIENRTHSISVPPDMLGSG